MKYIIIALLLTIVACAPKIVYKERNTSELVGTWGLYKSKHPDGTANYPKPTYFIKFNPNGTYTQAYIQKRGSAILFGDYKIVGDTLVVFETMKGTNGFTNFKQEADTVKLTQISNNQLEVHRHWYSFWTKKRKPYHNQIRFRPVSDDELEKFNTTYSKLINDYKRIESSK